MDSTVCYECLKQDSSMKAAKVQFVTLGQMELQNFKTDNFGFERSHCNTNTT